MRLSTKSRYGVRALFDIAYHSEESPAQIKTISQRQAITPRYLEQIFQKLKRAGIVKSIRGPRGGYYLARKPEEIAVGDVIRAMEESIEPVFCARPPKGRSRKCRRESKCVAQVIWREAGQRLGDYLDSVSLAQMCGMARGMRIEK
jgi:Rrf2 family transcriptional regulator, iron-sulfur cluster assembly transcription factor